MFYQIITEGYNVHKVYDKINSYGEVKKIFIEWSRPLLIQTDYYDQVVYNDRNDKMYVRKVFTPSENKPYDSKWKILKNKSDNFYRLKNADEKKQLYLSVKFSEILYCNR